MVIFKNNYLSLFSLVLISACGTEPPNTDNQNIDSSTEQTAPTIVNNNDKSCSIDNDLAYCDNGAFVYCDNGSWAIFNCPKGFTCTNDGLQALCLAQCDHEGDEGSICSSSIQLTTICTQLEDGLFQIPDYNSSVFCQSGCADLKVCSPD